METQFYLKDIRLGEFKKFIGSDLPSARFVYNVYKIGDTWSIALELSSEDGNKLNELRNKWWELDNPPKVEKQNILQRLWKYFG